MAKVLGLDIGSNSIGWCLVEDEVQEIVDTGVRIFQEGVAKQDEREEASRNAKRREARMMRRQIDRRRRRKRVVRNILIRYGLLPKNEGELVALMYRLSNPYALRSRALDEPLSAFELGRTLYHLNQRRGFKSNRKAQAEEEDSGTIYDGTKDGTKPGILVLREALQNGFRTIGEYFASLDTSTTRIRERLTERAMYEAEFDAIWTSQHRFHSDILTDEFRKELHRAIFYQRPLKSQKHRLGKCRFEPLKPKAPKSAPLSQRFRMLQSVNNLRIIGETRVDDDATMLTEEERNALIRHLTDVGDADFSKSTHVKDIFGFKKTDAYRFSLDKIKGLTTERAIRQAFGSDHYKRLSVEEIDKIWHALYYFEDQQKLIAHLREKWGLMLQGAEKLAKSRMEDGFMSVSTRFIRRVIPYLEQGLVYSDACVAAGYDHSSMNIVPGSRDRVNGIDTGTIRNPIVIRSMSETRKLVNAILAEYGKPDRIVLEVTRHLKKPLKERLEIEKRNKAENQLHEKLAEELYREAGVAKVRRDDIIKMKLWRQQGEVCVYTGRQIGIKQLIDGSTDVDHIIPYSRSLDDSQTNKVVCFRDANTEKGNRTPWETWGSDEGRWHEIKQRVAKLPTGKVKRLLADQEALEKLVGVDFIARQLNDTSYASRAIRDYLIEVCPDVLMSRGSLTSELRTLWGLNKVLHRQLGDETPLKNRDDHRHHAVDALVLALSSRSALQRLSTFNARAVRESGAKPRLDAPWPDLLEKAVRAIHGILVSHAMTQKVSGRFHEETIYGRARERFTGRPRRDERGDLFTVRKSLSSFTDTNMVYKIADDVIRGLAFKRLVEYGVDRADLEAGKKVKIPKGAFSTPLWIPSRHGEHDRAVKKVRIILTASKMFNLRGSEDNVQGAYVEPGNNYCYAIYKDERGKVNGIVITMFEAYRRRALGLPVVDPMAIPGAKLSSVFRENVMYVDASASEYETGKTDREWISSRLRRTKKITSGKITFIGHTLSRDKIEFADGATKELSYSKSPANALGQVVEIDVLGRVKNSDTK